MIRMMAVIALLASLFLSPPAGAARAKPTTASIKQMLHALSGGDVIIPSDWSGVYDTLDTLYLCDGPFFFAGTARDTFCAGDASDSESDCKGTATSTTLDMTCTDEWEESPTCHATSVSVIHATRVGSSFTLRARANTTHTGSDCSLYPDDCFEFVTHETRIGPAPTEFCIDTPARRTSWGQLKMLYR